MSEADLKVLITTRESWLTSGTQRRGTTSSWGAAVSAGTRGPRWRTLWPRSRLRGNPRNRLPEINLQQRWQLLDVDLNERAMEDNHVPFSPVDVPPALGGSAQ